MKKAQHDLIGYFSARGLSKYWGVSKQVQQSGGKDKWIVKYAQPLSGQNKNYVMFTAKDFVLKEEDAAHVAAYFFDNIKPLNEYPRLLTFRRPNSINKFLRLNIFTRQIELLDVYFAPTEEPINPFNRAVLTKPAAPVAPAKVEAPKTSMLDDIVAATKASEEDILAAMVKDFETLSIKQLLQLHYAIDDIIKVKVKNGSN